MACSDGRVRAIAALDALDEMGYTNIVGLRGGANLWTREWWGLGYMVSGTGVTGYRLDSRCLGFGVWGLGFGVWGLGFGVRV